MSYLYRQGVVDVSVNPSLLLVRVLQVLQVAGGGAGLLHATLLPLRMLPEDLLLPAIGRLTGGGVPHWMTCKPQGMNKGSVTPQLLHR